MIKQEEFEDFEDDEPIGVWHDCPNCGHPFDEIDFEYQMCHLCKYDANPTPPKIIAPE